LSQYKKKDWEESFTCSGSELPYFFKFGREVIPHRQKPGVYLKKKPSDADIGHREI
jgi:hypothetical protein